MRILLIPVILSALSACINKEDTSSEKISDSVKVTKDSIHKSNVEYFKRKEQRAIDSLKHYSILPFYDTYKNILYKVYGTAILKEIDSGKAITVGECDIKLIGFLEII